MKSIISILLIIFAINNVVAQNTLVGIITDKETNIPLSGVSVYFPDLRKSSTTDKSGRFEITQLPQGKFLVEVRYVGYSVFVQKIDINGETEINFELEQTHKELAEVVVTGVSMATQRTINPIPSIAIGNRTLHQTSSTNLIDAISNRPGISQITTGVGISKPVIRGLGFNRVVVLQNGIRQEGQQWGDEHGIEIDEFSIDRAEIIKGPGSLMYGSDAMAGVINFLPPNPVEQGKITADFLTSYHSNNNQIGYSLRNAGNINGIHWLIQGTGKQAGNYSNAYDGRVYNSGFNEINLNGSVGINKKWGYSNINFSTFNQNVGIIEGERDSLGNFVKPIIINNSILEEQTVSHSDLSGYSLGIPRQEINHHRISTSNKFMFQKSSLNVNLGFQQSHRKEIEYHFEDGEYEEEAGIYLLLNTVNYDINYHLPEFDGWESSIGLNGYYQTNANRGEDFIIPDYSLFDAGIFAITKKSFNKLHLAGGLRYNTRSIKTNGLFLDEDGEPINEIDAASEIRFTSFTNTFSAIAGSIGASYEFKKSIIGKLNMSNGFRAPNIAELASNGAHEGTFRYEIGNPAFKPETSIQIDAGLLIDAKHVTLELGIFQNTVNNYIYLQKLYSLLGGDSLIIDGDKELQAFQFVQGNANLYGGEFSIDIHPHPIDWLHFENSFSIVRGIQNNQPDSLKYLPFMPAPRFQTELRAQFNKIGKWSKNFYAKVELSYYLEQNQFFSAYGTETRTPSYTLLNAGIGSDIVNKNGQTIFSIFFTASNILDVAYQSHLNRLKYAAENPTTGRMGVFNMGRNFNVKLIAPLTIKKK